MADALGARMKCRRWCLAGSLPFLAVIAACGSSNSGPGSHQGGGPQSGSALGGSHQGGNAASPSNETMDPRALSHVPRQPASEVPSDVVAAVVAANNAFAVDLYAHLRQDPALDATKNVLTSPLSASLALTMTYAGARAETATQMATALHLGSAPQSIFAGQNALSQALAGRQAAALATLVKNQGAVSAETASDYQLQVVNSVWGEKTCVWEAPFLDILAKNYGAGVQTVDFVNQSEGARVLINGWVSDQTANKINDLLPQGSITRDSRMVLVNAIHLKFPWMTAFSPQDTTKAAFTKADGSTLMTDTMHLQTSLSYVDDGKAQIVALPLVGQELSVVIALPHGDLATYEAGLTSASLAPPSAWQQISLSLPKFAFTSPTFSLARSLSAMGMPEAFDEKRADFTGVGCPSSVRPLFISDVLQKTMVAVQETGVEAAAATAVSMAQTSTIPPTPIPMDVDRPFVMAIVDVPTGATLFLGHITDPADSGSP